MKDAASEYERHSPDAAPDAAQKQERMERIRFKDEAGSLRRTTRTRGIVVPPLPTDDNGRLRP